MKHKTGSDSYCSAGCKKYTSALHIKSVLKKSCNKNICYLIVNLLIQGVQKVSTSFRSFISPNRNARLTTYLKEKTRRKTPFAKYWSHIIQYLVFGNRMCGKCM